MQVIQSLKSRIMKLPVYGGGADIFPGSMLMPGVTAETNDGVLIANTAASNADAIGVLVQLHDYSVEGDALVAGSAPWFSPDGSAEKDYPADDVELLAADDIVQVDMDLTSYVAATSSSGTTVTIGSLEDNIDTGFLYIASGTDAGMLRFIATSAAGSCVTSVAFSPVLDGTSQVVKILPLFHQLVVWTAPSATAGTKLGTTAAVGTGRALIMERLIERNGKIETLDPYTHRNLSGLSSLSQLRFACNVVIQNTGFHPID